jgi:hypothetical protein
MSGHTSAYSNLFVRFDPFDLFQEREEEELLFVDTQTPKRAKEAKGTPIRRSDPFASSVTTTVSRGNTPTHGEMRGWYQPDFCHLRKIGLLL